MTEDVVTLMAVKVRSSCAVESAVPVVKFTSRKITVASQFWAENEDDESVAWAKYCTLNVVVVFVVPPVQVLDAVNAVAR